MHGSIQLIIATESDRIRQAEASRNRAVASRSPFAALRSRIAARGNGGAAHRSPLRAAPSTAGTDARALGHPSAASLRGR
jgi:hypothetical protein